MARIFKLQIGDTLEVQSPDAEGDIPLLFTEEDEDRPTFQSFLTFEEAKALRDHLDQLIARGSN